MMKLHFLSSNCNLGSAGPAASRLSFSLGFWTHPCQVLGTQELSEPLMGTAMLCSHLSLFVLTHNLQNLSRATF